MSTISYSLAAVAINYGVDCSNKQRETKVISLSKYALATDAYDLLLLVRNAAVGQRLNEQSAISRDS